MPTRNSLPFHPRSEGLYGHFELKTFFDPVSFISFLKENFDAERKHWIGTLSARAKQHFSDRYLITPGLSRIKTSYSDGAKWIDYFWFIAGDETIPFKKNNMMDCMLVADDGQAYSREEALAISRPGQVKDQIISPEELKERIDDLRSRIGLVQV